MTPERWQQIETLYHAALERAPDERAAFLAKACAEDADLRREVEELLRYDGAAQSFIEENALAVEARQLETADLSQTEAPALTGQQIGTYKILAPLGKGGMGEVWLAEDTRLRRKVALKLLPAEFTRHTERVRRFEQEARAASALNHPNILTIFEIGQASTEAGGAHFIATEFIDGQTLRARLTGDRLSLIAALEIASQTAAALAAAHEAGIIHRDIKPENVMLRRDSIVKVLDFGLAKLTEQRPDTVDSQAPTLAQVNTDPGTVLGTASYMSPEQARGQEVDARSDVFSLGVVLYEMLTGRAPFAGANAVEVLGAILNHEPAPLLKHAAEAPAELQRIVAKALRKDREQRYQHVQDLLLDLKDLKQEIEFEAKLKGAQAFVVPGGSVQRREPPPEGGTTNAQPAEAATDEATATRTTSSAEIIFSEIKRHKTGVFISLAGLLACVALLGYGLYRFVAPKQSIAHFQNVKLTRLTSVGNVGQSASVSPDGKFIAYVQTEAGQNSLWTKAIATGSAVQIIPPSAAIITATMFSPDGNYVYYKIRSDGPFYLYQIPVLGGTPKKVLTGDTTRISFSPDGGQFAFARGRPELAKSELVVVNADGSGERVLATRELRENFRGVAWSPDGKVIAALALSLAGAEQITILLGVAVASGEVKPLVHQPLILHTEFTNYIEWFKDGSGLALLNSEKSYANLQIWQISYPDGELRRITNDLARYVSLSMTADGTLVAIQRELQSTLWTIPFSATGRAQQLTRGNNLDGFNGVRWTPDGRIVYTSSANGKPDLWLMNADGSQARPLTDDVARDYFPVVAPDGRSLIYATNRSGQWNLWRTDIDGSNPRQLMNRVVGVRFDLSPDGRWLIFENREPEPIKLYKVSLDGGTPALQTEQPSTAPTVSPEGKWIACISNDPQSRQMKVLILPFEGGPPIKALELKTLDSPFGVSPLRWTPDGRSLIYIDTRQGATNLWRLPLAGGPSQPVTSFNDARPERIWAFDFARDGKQLVIARGGDSADVVLISEVK